MKTEFMAVKITNKFNLPEIVVKASLYDTHRVAGDISCSQLIDAPQVRILKKKHDYNEDISERLYALMGTALHNILERANISDVRKRAFILTYETIIDKASEMAEDKSKQQLLKAAEYIRNLSTLFFKDMESDYLFEQTMRMEINGKTLYGTFDLYRKSTQVLYDYKFCSTHQWTYPESQKKWKQQTNVYATLLEEAGYPVKKIVVVAFFRDWSSAKMLTSKDYPKQQIMEIEVSIAPPDQRISFIKSRLDKHMQAEDSGILPLCTGKERWASADMWAAKTIKVKRALRVLESEKAIDDFIAENRHKYEGLHKEYRPGSSVRCEKYCPVAEFCSQFKTEKEIRLKLADNE